jgi:hypothetical protein
MHAMRAAAGWLGAGFTRVQSLQGWDPRGKTPALQGLG